MSILSLLSILIPVGVQVGSIFIKNPKSQQIEAVIVGEIETILHDLQGFHFSRTSAPQAPAAK